MFYDDVTGTQKVWNKKRKDVSTFKYLIGQFDIEKLTPVLFVCLYFVLLLYMKKSCIRKEHKRCERIL